MTDTTSDRAPIIVYVEDNAGDATLLKEALLDRQYQVDLVVLPTGEEALRYFDIHQTSSQSRPPHCVLLDSHLPAVSGQRLLRILRGSPAFDDTPVYIFSSECDYADVLAAGVVSRESFLSKATTWDAFLDLADLLMRSATAKQDDRIANATDRNPEVHAEGSLRRQETQAQRDRTKHGKSQEPETGLTIRPKRTR